MKKLSRRDARIRENTAGLFQTSSIRSGQTHFEILILML